MKKIVLAMLTVLLLFPASVSARGWRGGYGGHWHADRSVWPVVGAVVAGGVVLSALSAPFYPVRTSYSPPPLPACFTEVYGEWRQDRYGNRFWQEFSHPRRVTVPCW